MTPATTSTSRRGEVAQLQADGFLPIRLRGWGDFRNRKAPVEEGFLQKNYRPEEWQAGEGIGLRLGVQPSGLRLYVLDLDSHGPTQDAVKFLNWIHFQTGEALVRELFESLFDDKRWNDRAYQRVMRQRRSQSRATNDYFEKLREMSTAGLTRRIRSIEERLVRTSLDGTIKAEREARAQADGRNIKPERRPRTPAQLKTDLKLLRAELQRRLRESAALAEPEHQQTEPAPPPPIAPPSVNMSVSLPIIWPSSVVRERAQLLRELQGLDPALAADARAESVMGLRMRLAALRDSRGGPDAGVLGGGIG